MKTCALLPGCCCDACSIGGCSLGDCGGAATSGPHPVVAAAASIVKASAKGRVAAIINDDEATKKLRSAEDGYGIEEDDDEDEEEDEDDDDYDEDTERGETASSTLSTSSGGVGECSEVGTECGDVVVVSPADAVGVPGVVETPKSRKKRGKGKVSGGIARVARGRRVNRGIVFLAISGVISLVVGVLSIIWTPFDLFMNERLKMVRGLPAYEWWRNPPDEVLLRVYVFNITNGPAFLEGKEKLRVEEVGPFIFREKLRHTNITFNDNGTLTYVAHRTAHFLPEMNTLSLNASLVLPNLPLLGMASYLHDAAFLTKVSFNFFLRRFNAQPLVKMTVNDYFWNYSDPMLKTAKQLLPFLVPVDNMGILHTIYQNFRDEVTVYIGPGNGDRFFLIDKFRGSRRLGYWDEEPCDVASGSSEGVAYPQFLTKNFTLLYLRKTLCRVTPLYYAQDMQRKGMLAYRFNLPNNSFDTSEKYPENSCYIRDYSKSKILPAGLLDVSPCYYDFPIAASFPHFMNGATSLLNSMDGLNPDNEKHGSYVIVEPITGVPMESRARSQSNLVIRNITGINRVGPFNGLVVPMFWAEYNQVGLPWYISSLMYFVVVILPSFQKVLSVVFILLGIGQLLVVSFGCFCTPVSVAHKHWRRNLPRKICMDEEKGNKACIAKICKSKPVVVPYSYSFLDLVPSSTSSSEIL
ncbi:scavenger receptor class B member 1-like [Ischnura elegans]|uniref:scavenger receptor class B member 1-like n=1 Tax=Ischnura elegans TaxID=197161 RepID=UPI001ED8845F|nr:scavenger receptor class B member 1-like [Ischnura elegans]XP_046383939.1 scavenger receptor class B member 1-like [Ischnura elegans]